MIHIQNKHFRYQINEAGFLHLAATVLRARSEMDYYKTHNIVNRGIDEFSCRNEVDKKGYRAIETICKILNQEKVNYRFIEAGEKYATIIVDPAMYESLHRIIQKNGEIKKHIHPYSSMFSYAFLYQMREFELYEYEGFYFEVFFQLPCMSLTPMTWIPLDRRIQSIIWSSEGVGTNNTIDPRCYYIFRLCWAVFKDKGFSAYTRSVLAKYNYVLADKEFLECIRLVFFQFSSLLVELLSRDDYESIIPSYFGFENY